MAFHAREHIHTRHRHLAVSLTHAAEAMSAFCRASVPATRTLCPETWDASVAILFALSFSAPIFLLSSSLASDSISSTIIIASYSYLSRVTYHALSSLPVDADSTSSVASISPVIALPPALSLPLSLCLCLSLLTSSVPEEAPAHHVHRVLVYHNYMNCLVII